MAPAKAFATFADGDCWTICRSAVAYKLQYCCCLALSAGGLARARTADRRLFHSFVDRPLSQCATGAHDQHRLDLLAGSSFWFLFSACQSRVYCVARSLEELQRPTRQAAAGCCSH